MPVVGQIIEIVILMICVVQIVAQNVDLHQIRALQRVRVALIVVLIVALIVDQIVVQGVYLVHQLVILIVAQTCNKINIHTSWS